MSFVPAMTAPPTVVVVNPVAPKLVEASEAIAVVRCTGMGYGGEVPMSVVTSWPDVFTLTRQ